MSVPAGNNNIDVIRVEDVGGKKRIIIGDSNAEIVFQVQDSPKVQIGTRFVDLLTEQVSSNNSGTVLTVETYDNVISNGKSYISDLSENQIIYDTYDSSLYIVRGGMFIKLNSSTSSTVSSSSTSSVNQETAKFVKELIVQYRNQLATFVYDKIYRGILVYVIDDMCHYVLTGDDRKQLSNWKPAYISWKMGGSSISPIILSTGNETSEKSILHIDGYANVGSFREVDKTKDVLTIGKYDGTVLASWVNSTGEAIIHIDSVSSLTSGLKIITTSGGKPYNIANMHGNRIALCDAISNDYDLTVNMSTLFKQQVTFQSKIQSTDFNTGTNGMGYRIAKDPIDQTWILEIDKIKVRQPDIATSKQIYYTEGINGSKLFNKSYSIETTSLLGQYDHFIIKEFYGEYVNNSGSYSKLDYEDYCFIPTNNVINSILSRFNIVSTYIMYPFHHGSHKLSIINNVATYTQQPNTFQLNGTNYVVATGTHNYDNTNSIYVEASGGSHVFDRTLYFYSIAVNEMGDIVDGDMFVIQKFNKYRNQELFINLYCIKSRTGDNLFVSDSEINTGDVLFRIGNCLKTYTSEYVDGSTNVITLNDPQSSLTKLRDVEVLYPYLFNDSNLIESDDLIEGSFISYHGIRSFNDFSYEQIMFTTEFSQYQTAEERSGILINNDKINLKIGRLGDIVNKDLLLDSLTKNKQSFYVKDGYFIGNAVINNGKFGQLMNKEGILFINTLNKTLSEYTNTDIINHYKKANNALFLDTVNSKLSIGSNLWFENSTLKLANLKDVSDDFKTLVDVTLPNELALKLTKGTLPTGITTAQNILEKIGMDQNASIETLLASLGDSIIDALPSTDKSTIIKFLKALAINKQNKYLTQGKTLIGNSSNFAEEGDVISEWGVGITMPGQKEYKGTVVDMIISDGSTVTIPVVVRKNITLTATGTIQLLSDSYAGYYYVIRNITLIARNPSITQYPIISIGCNSSTYNDIAASQVLTGMAAGTKSVVVTTAAWTGIIQANNPMFLNITQALIGSGAYQIIIEGYLTSI